MKYKNPYYRVRPNKKTGMNKTEAAFAAYLKLRQAAGEIEAWAYEPWTIKIAENLTYKPDFKVVFPDYIAFYEVKPASKGKPFSMDDGYLIKIKIAAKDNPEFAFRITWPDKLVGWREREL